MHFTEYFELLVLETRFCTLWISTVYCDHSVNVSMAVFTRTSSSFLTIFCWMGKSCWCFFRMHSGRFVWGLCCGRKDAFLSCCAVTVQTSCISNALSKLYCWINSQMSKSCLCCNNGHIFLSSINEQYSFRKGLN